MRHLPIFLDLRGRGALVVGGTSAAARKAASLAAVGGRVTVLAEMPDREMLATCAATGISRLARRFEATDLAGRALLIVDTGDGDEDARIAAAAKSANVPVNVIDAPALSTFIFGAIVDRDPVTVAISTGGAAPVLARHLRARVEALLPARLGRLASFAERFRTAVAAVRGSGRTRRRFWEKFFAGPIAALVLAGNERAASEEMLSLINRQERTQPGGMELPPGLVSIVGAGPGDPDLLTLKAARALEEADVIVYDRLVSDAVLERGRRDAEYVFVGKVKGSHVVTQEQINVLLVEKARAGLRVVRLKGGDPFVFGRGGEEQRHLRDNGIQVEIVPGITAALGCAAAARIPLTHRAHAQAVTLVTGHGEQGEPEYDWSALAGDKRTLAVYMGASTAGRIAEKLLAAGAEPDLPVAVIVNGTRPDQRVESGCLADLARLAEGCAGDPALLVIGDVVREAEGWGDAASGKDAAPIAGSRFAVAV